MSRHQFQCQISGCQSSQDEKENLDDIGITNHFHSAKSDDNGEDCQHIHTSRSVDAGNAVDCQRSKV
ncbi:hypothetical protein D3C86_1861490 [compost metagenome]